MRHLLLFVVSDMWAQISAMERAANIAKARGVEVGHCLILLKRGGAPDTASHLNDAMMQFPSLASGL